VTKRDDFDRDDELRAMLTAADPARSLAPAREAGLARLLEETMSHDIDIREDEPVMAPTGTEGRNPLVWLGAAAAVFVIAGGGFFAAARIGGEDPPQAQDPPTSQEPTVTQLSAPPAVEAKCAVPTAEILATQEIALAGTVVAIDDDTVTIETTTVYAGDVGDHVEVEALPADLQALILGVDFEVGGHFLVAASEGQVAICGLSGTASPELQQLYEEAFAG
jgi:hypothetical protein